MGSRLLESDLLAAAQRVSSAPTSYRRLPGGAPSKDAEWDTLRGRISRALLADPDIVIYFAYLASNRACKYAQETAALLCSAVVAIEGWKFWPAEPAAPTKLQQVVSSLNGRTNLSAEDIARLQQATENYIERSALPAMSKNGRAQVQGSEAVAAYQSAITPMLVSLQKLLTALSYTTSRRDFVPETLRTYALQTPSAALAATADLYDPEKLTEFVVQLAAANAAVEAIGRPVDLALRMRLGESAFPDGVSAETSGSPISTVTPSTSPLLLGIKSGDVVTVLGGSATVQIVGEASVTLQDSTILSEAGLTIQSSPYMEWNELVRVVSPIYTALPSVESLKAELRRKEDFSAARIRTLMERLFALAAVLDEPSADAVDALARIGGTAPSVTATATQLLRDFEPLFGSATEQAGDRILSDLETAGLDYAVELLYYGQLSQLMELTAGQLSLSGRVSTAASSLGVYTGSAYGMG